MIQRKSIAFTLLLISVASAQEQTAPYFTIERATAHSGFDGNTCWVHARAGAIPPGAPGTIQANRWS